VVEMLRPCHIPDDWVDATGQSTSPLHIAAQKGMNAALVHLIENGAVVDRRDELGLTPLHAAAKSDQVVTARTLVAAKASLTALVFNKLNPLDITVIHDSLSLVEFLVRADPSLRPEAFLLAARDGHFLAIKILLASGVDVDIRNAEGQTALVCALSRRHQIFIYREGNNRRKRVFAADMLIHCGADVNVHDQAGETPLTIAAKQRDVVAVNLLIDTFANVDLPDTSKTTALMIAVDSANVPLIITLLAAGADTSLRDIFGKTAWDRQAFLRGRAKHYHGEVYTRNEIEELIAQLLPTTLFCAGIAWEM